MVLLWKDQTARICHFHLQIVCIQKVGTCLPRREGVLGPTQLLHTPLEGQVTRTRTTASTRHDQAQ
jgi:hypothetical protein